MISGNVSIGHSGIDLFIFLALFLWFQKMPTGNASRFQPAALWRGILSFFSQNCKHSEKLENQVSRM